MLDKSSSSILSRKACCSTLIFVINLPCYAEIQHARRKNRYPVQGIRSLNFSLFQNLAVLRVGIIASRNTHNFVLVHYSLCLCRQWDPVLSSLIESYLQGLFRSENMMGRGILDERYNCGLSTPPESEVHIFQLMFTQ